MPPEKSSPDSESRLHKISLAYPGHALKPEDILDFIELPPFTRRWDQMGLDVEEDLLALQVMIMADPEGGELITGTGGLRKMRFAPARWNTGKSGAARVMYAYFRDFGVVLLCVAHGKNEVETISKAVRNYLAKLIGETERELHRLKTIRLG